MALTLTRPADLSFSRPHRASCLSPPSLLPPPPHSDGPRFSSIFAGATRHGYIRSAHAFGGIIYVIEAVPPCAPPPRGDIHRRVENAPLFSRRYRMLVDTRRVNYDNWYIKKSDSYWRYGFIYIYIFFSFFFVGTRF